MENQINVSDQNTQQISQNHVRQQSKPKVNYWIISTIVMFVVLAGVGIFTFSLVKQNETKFTFIQPTATVSQNNQKLSTSPTTQPLLPSAQTSSGCEIVKNYNYAINNSPTIENWCEIRVFYDWGKDKGYSLSFPRDWQVILRGATGTNISLEKDKKWMVFVSIAQTDLSVENYDQIKQGYEQSPPSPIVDPEYKVVNKEIVQINNKRVMKVLTNFENIKYVYYLFDNGLIQNKSVYAVRIHGEVSDSDADKILQSFTPKFL